MTASPDVVLRKLAHAFYDSDRLPILLIGLAQADRTDATTQQAAYLAEIKELIGLPKPEPVVYVQCSTCHALHFRTDACQTVTS